MELITLILNFVLGSGLIGVLLFYNSKRRKENASAAAMELDATAKQIDYLSRQLSDMFAENDRMQELLDRKKAELLELKRQFNELKLQLLDEEYRRKEAEYNMCTVKECSMRIPPRKLKNENV